MLMISRILKSTLVRNFFSLSILQGFNYILPLFLVPFLFKRLGIETYGLVNFAQAFIMYFFILSDFGFGLSAVKSISQAGDDKLKREEVFNSVMICRMLICLIGFIILVILVNSVAKFQSEKLLYYYSYLIVLGNSLFPIWFFQGVEKMKFITWINIIARLLSIIPLFFLVKSSDDYLFVPLAYGIGYLVSALISLVVIKMKFKMKFCLPSRYIILYHFKDSSQYFLSRVSVSLFTNTNSFLLGLVLGDYAVGIYTSAEKLYRAYNSLTSSLYQALYPYMIRTKDISLYKRLIKNISLLNIVLISILIYFADFIVLQLFDSSDESLIVTLRILFAVCWVTIPEVLLGYPLLGAFGFAKEVNMSVVYAAIFHIFGVLILYLLNAVSIYNVALMVFITEFLLTIYRWVLSRKLIVGFK